MFNCVKQDDEIAGIKRQTQQYIKLIGLREAKPPDMEKINTVYIEDLTDILVSADRIKHGLRKRADDFMSKAKSSEVKTPFLQGVEKSVQQAFILLIKNTMEELLNNYDNTASAMHLLNKISALYEAIENTARRRGKYIGQENIFHDSMLSAFKKIKRGINSKDRKIITEGNKEIYRLFDKIYFLSVVYELEGIAKNRGKDDVKAHEKQIEGFLFFEIIKDSAKERKASGIIESELSKPVSEINIKLVKNNLKIAFTELFSAYKDKL